MATSPVHLVLISGDLENGGAPKTHARLELLDLQKEAADSNRTLPVLLTRHAKLDRLHIPLLISTQPGKRNIPVFCLDDLRRHGLQMSPGYKGSAPTDCLLCSRKPEQEGICEIVMWLVPVTDEQDPYLYTWADWRGTCAAPSPPSLSSSHPAILLSTTTKTPSPLPSLPVDSLPPLPPSPSPPVSPPLSPRPTPVVSPPSTTSASPDSPSNFQQHVGFQDMSVSMEKGRTLVPTDHQFDPPTSDGKTTRAVIRAVLENHRRVNGPEAPMEVKAIVMAARAMGANVVQSRVNSILSQSHNKPNGEFERADESHSGLYRLRMLPATMSAKRHTTTVVSHDDEDAPILPPLPPHHPHPQQPQPQHRQQQQQQMGPNEDTRERLKRSLSPSQLPPSQPPPMQQPAKPLTHSPASHPPSISPRDQQQQQQQPASRRQDDDDDDIPRLPPA